MISNQITLDAPLDILSHANYATTGPTSSKKKGFYYLDKTDPFIYAHQVTPRPHNCNLDFKNNILITNNSR